MGKDQQYVRVTGGGLKNKELWRKWRLIVFSNPAHLPSPQNSGTPQE
jgi:hypothetical protein